VIGVAQRVLEARVVVDGKVIGQIQKGLLLLLCAEQGDTTLNADKMLSKLLKLRIFGDEEGKMNRSLQDLDGNGLHGGLLVVSQFTLAADVSGGNRPSFKRAASPADGQRLYDYFVVQAREAHSIVQTGQFAADMKVHLVNDGPVTIPLQM
jgi:D-tyrosyl-tRNA(Tyr) deacylase